VQALANGPRDLRRSAPARRQAVQPHQHPAQAVENAAALGALPGVPLQARSRPRRKVAIEVGRHVGWSPPVIPPEARAVENAVHSQSDPPKIERGSHSPSRA